MSDAQYNLDRLNVLVLDDDRNMRTLIETILFELGVRNIRQAHDVKQAFGDLRYFHVDIVITDWKMEPLNGLDFVRMVRSGDDSPNPYVPIIMLTGHTEPHLVCEARDAGVNEFLAKPISAKSLYSRLVSIIECPRPFIRTKTYFGPCRRRRNMGAPRGMKERRVDEQAMQQENKPRMKVKTGRGQVEPDAQAVQCAEAAIEKIGDDYANWAQTDLDEMDKAVAAARKNPDQQEDYVMELCRRAMELKSQGGGFGYDLISQVGDSLKNFTESRSEANPRDVEIIAAHVDAMRVVMVEDIKGDGGEVGRAIVDSLYKLTTKS